MPVYWSTSAKNNLSAKTRSWSNNPYNRHSGRIYGSALDYTRLISEDDLSYSSPFVQLFISSFFKNFRPRPSILLVQPSPPSLYDGCASDGYF